MTQPARAAVTATPLKIVKSAHPPLDREQGTSFGFWDRMFYGFDDGAIFDYGDWEARDLEQMFKADYKSKQIDAVLSMPLMSADKTITGMTGDSGEADWLNTYWAADPLDDGCDTSLWEIMARMTTAISYKRAFQEKVWTQGSGQFDGKIVYKRLGWRPQTMCRMMRHPKHGGILGFEEYEFYLALSSSGSTDPVRIYEDVYDKHGQIQKFGTAFTHIHGAWRDPINGVSEQEIPYWAFKTKQKIMFLMMQFLEGVSLPRLVVKGQDETETKQIAQNARQLKSSGVLPAWSNSGPTGIALDSLDMSGTKGAEQFLDTIKWLDSCATGGVLAGFLDLTQAAAGGAGSYALSNDASDFFLQTEEARAREMEQTVRKKLFAPLIKLNFGPKAVVPKLTFQPLSSEDVESQITMLTALVGSRDPALVPGDFIADLAGKVADMWGMDGAKVAASFNAAAATAAQQAAATSAAGATGMGQQVAQVTGATNAALVTVAKAKAAQAKAGTTNVAPAPKPPKPPAPVKPKPTPPKPTPVPTG